MCMRKVGRGWENLGEVWRQPRFGDSRGWVWFDEVVKGWQKVGEGEAEHFVTGFVRRGKVILGNAG